MRYEVLRRFAAKLVHDVLPAALASLIGGLLYSHFPQVYSHFAQGRAPEPMAAQASPASPQMMQLLRDEHGLIVSFVSAQIEGEKRQAAASDNTPPAAVEPSPAAAPRPANVAPAAARTPSPHPRTQIVGASLPPLAIAGAQPADSVKPPPRVEDTLVDKTIGIRDHVLAVTQRAVSVLGGIPSWIGSISDRIGGDDASQRPRANLVSAS